MLRKRSCARYVVGVLCLFVCVFFFFFFQAEDGIRDWSVTGVQTCALPIRPIGKSVYKILVLPLWINFYHYQTVID